MRLVLGGLLLIALGIGGLITRASSLLSLPEFQHRLRDE
jgi:hypothetical protein